MASPKKNGSEPITSNTATMSPQIAMGTGLAATARTDVHSATAAPTSRSTSSGNDTALITSTSTAYRKPMPLPHTISCQPVPVVSTSCAKLVSEVGASTPNSD